MKTLSQWGCVFAVLAGTLVAGVANAQQGSDQGQEFRAKQILGFKVFIQGDMAVGSVDDIVIDDHGNVDYLIVATSENQLLTVPWDAVRLHPGKRLAVVHISQAAFQKVPTYTAKQYPVYTAPTYRTQVYQHYGLTPSQERRVIRRITP